MLMIGFTMLAALSGIIATGIALWDHDWPMAIWAAAQAVWALAYAKERWGRP